MKILKSVEKNFVLLLRDRDLIGTKLEIIQDFSKFAKEHWRTNGGASGRRGASGGGDWFIAGCLGPCAATTAENLKREWDSLRKLKEWKNFILSDAHKGFKLYDC